MNAQPAPAAAETGVRDLVADAAAQLAADDIETAIATLQQAGADQTGEPRANLVMGLIAWRLADIERAIGIVADLHERAPMNGTVAEVLASLYAQVGNLN